MPVSSRQFVVRTDKPISAMLKSSLSRRKRASSSARISGIRVIPSTPLKKNNQLKTLLANRKASGCLHRQCLPMAESLWHPHSGRNPRNVSKTRFFPNKNASNVLTAEPPSRIPSMDAVPRHHDHHDFVKSTDGQLSFNLTANRRSSHHHPTPRTRTLPCGRFSVSCGDCFN